MDQGVHVYMKILLQSSQMYSSLALAGFRRHSGASQVQSSRCHLLMVGARTQIGLSICCNCFEA
jgi:hypothetical protein